MKTLNSIHLKKTHEKRDFQLVRYVLRTHYLCLALLSLFFFQPVFALLDEPLVQTPPTNVLLDLSVEFPTANQSANFRGTETYDNRKKYWGYFDSAKCYEYVNTSPATDGYFKPSAKAINAAIPPYDFGCPVSTTTWSGNFLNFATTQSIDPFRKALTGGTRSVDTPTKTVLKKAFNNHDTYFFNTVTITNAALIASISPTNWPKLCVHVSNQGFRMVFYNCLTTTSAPPADEENTTQYPTAVTNPSSYYQAYVAVQVCDPNPTHGGLETNCRQYGSSYKPTGILQKYSSEVRFGAMGYLNDSVESRDGGVLRAKLGYVGPTMNIPSDSAAPNPLSEWDAQTGVFIQNPRPADSSATTAQTGVPIIYSGVTNYLNMFGSIQHDYKGYDPVSELYYASTRYFRGLPNVPAWSNLNSSLSITDKTKMLDDFPVITNWTDEPAIAYSCQKNAILGIGDIFTHWDGNVPGSRLTTSPIPPEVLADTFVNAATRTNQVGIMEKSTNYPTANQSLLSSLPNPLLSDNFRFGHGGTTRSGTTGTLLIAGLAYDAHTRDQRPDLNDIQTIETYWLDVLEDAYVKDNQYFLAAKYGGFDTKKIKNLSTANGFNPDTYDNSPLDSASWSKTEENTDVGGVVQHATATDDSADPANYFRANNAESMIKGLDKAFYNIIKKTLATGGLTLAQPIISDTGTMSYTSVYSTGRWSGTVNAYTVRENPAWVSSSGFGSLFYTQVWNANELLNNQTNRFIATNNKNTASIGPNRGQGIPFTTSRLTNASLKASLGTAAELPKIINYLRGDRSQEQPVGNYRTRNIDGPLGDIINAKIVAVGPPNSVYLDSKNPGYATFKQNNRNRKSAVYYPSNDGMLHAFNGADPTTDSNAGHEMFAYIPSFVFTGPNGTPSIDGLAALTRPDYSHHYYIDATPVITDVDMGYVGGSRGAPAWESLLVGGLGKGGKGFYALNVTDPNVTNEIDLAAKVKWEFSDARMGYSYGSPVIVKTARYGWVVILTSGYENSDGKGYFFIVNPKTGQLLQTISTNTGTLAAPAGLTHAAAFVNQYTNGTADAVYAGDLLGNVWRVDLTPLAGTYPIQKIAELKNSAGQPQPITSQPLIEMDRYRQNRYVLIGTGSLLDKADILNTAIQSFYSFKDGDQTHFSTTATATFPITRSQLENVNLSSTRAPAAGWAVGWYVDFDPSERMTATGTTYNGRVAFFTTIPAAAYCETTGGYTYGFEIFSGDGILSDGTSAILTRRNLTNTFHTISLVFVNTPTGVQLYSSNEEGINSIQQLPLTESGYGVIPTLKNWRNAPTLE